MSGYIPALPTANQTIAQTQAPINTNFTVINTAFGVDHTPMTTLTNQGNHAKVTLIGRSSPSAVAVGPILYSNISGGKNEIFFKQASGDGSASVQLTDMGNPVLAVSGNGSTFLPGGIIMKWGRAVIPGSNNTIAVVFTNAFPSACFMAQATPNSGSSGVQAFSPGVNSLSTTGFSINVQNAVSSPLGLYWIAIGN